MGRRLEPRARGRSLAEANRPPVRALLAAALARRRSGATRPARASTPRRSRRLEIFLQLRRDDAQHFSGAGEDAAIGDIQRAVGSHGDAARLD